MPKPKPQRDSVFGGGEEEQSPIPFIPASGINQIYETGFAGLPSTVFEDPSQKRIDELEAQLAQLVQGQDNELALNDGTLIVQGFQFSPTGLIAPEEFTEVAWEQVGQILFKLEGSIQWLIGDWLAYGSHWKYGDIRRLAEELGRDENTLSNYKAVCQNVQFPRRRGNLSFAHHEAVSKFDPDTQEHYLAYAEEANLNRADFRKWIKEQQGGQSTPALRSVNVDFDIDTPSRGLKKFIQRDPVTLKPKERAEVIGYLTELERLISDYKRRMGV